jgi:glycosyltransferase involved in cell wall biosynthesis
MAQLSEHLLVSVVIPAFNRAKLINIPLKSVLNQSHQELEILVIDDGSTDDTESVVRAIGDPRVTYIRCQDNQGGATARNRGIDAAQGTYIAFLDSDDAWVPHKIETQLNDLLEQAQPEQTVSYTQVFYSASGISDDTYHHFDRKFILPKHGKDEHDTIAEYLFCKQGKTLTSTLMLSRSLASRIRFRDGLRKHQDWDFCIRLEAQGAAFRFIQEPLTIWNGDPSYEHVGRSPNYHISESWFNDCKQHISSRASAAFFLDKIFPLLMKEGNRERYAQRIVINAFFQRLISFGELKKLSKKTWHF